ncbi:MAG: hypothetical protein R3E87_11215 [Burkholderiaceae bacterium]
MKPDLGPFEALLRDDAVATPPPDFARRVLTRITAVEAENRGPVAMTSVRRGVAPPARIGFWRACAMALAGAYGLAQTAGFVLGAWIAVGAQ